MSPIAFVLVSPFITAAVLAAAIYVTLPWIDDGE